MFGLSACMQLLVRSREYLEVNNSWRKYSRVFTADEESGLFAHDFIKTDIICMAPWCEWNSSTAAAGVPDDVG